VTAHNNTHSQGDVQRFAEAIAIANVPTLLMVLVQLTGDHRWLEEPYQPQRARGMGDNDTYNERIDQAHENMVWTHPGMETYYRNARGRVVVNSPYRNATFYDMTREADLGDFIVESRLS